MQQMLRDVSEVDLCPHQRYQVYCQPLLTCDGELLFLVLRRQNREALDKACLVLSPLCWWAMILHADVPNCHTIFPVGRHGVGVGWGRWVWGMG